MDSKVKPLIERAEHEILTANHLKKVSEDSKLKELSNIPSSTTFYSAVIEHAYYAIFNCAKAYLVSKDIELPEQGQHQAVYYKFRKFVQQGILSKELLEIYEEVKIKAKALLEILEKEEKKRTEYTYKTLPQANRLPAEDSIENADFFVRHLRLLIEKEENNI